MGKSVLVDQDELYRLRKLEDITKIAVDVMGKAGYLLQANLEENPYIWIEALGLIEGKAPRSEVLMFAMRNLIQYLQEDPKAWEEKQNKIALKSCKQSIATLESELRSYEKWTIGGDSRYSGWGRNLWALDPLKKLEKKLEAKSKWIYGCSVKAKGPTPKPI